MIEKIEALSSSRKSQLKIWYVSWWPVSQVEVWIYPGVGACKDIVLIFLWHSGRVNHSIPCSRFFLKITIILKVFIEFVTILHLLFGWVLCLFVSLFWWWYTWALSSPTTPPVLEGKVLTTGSPGKSLLSLFSLIYKLLLSCFHF